MGRLPTEKVKEEFTKAAGAYAKVFGNWMRAEKRYTDAAPGTLRRPIPDAEVVLCTADLEEMNQPLRELADAHKKLDEAWRRLHKAYKRYYREKK